MRGDTLPEDGRRRSLTASEQRFDNRRYHIGVPTIWVM
jgi:hypothetical protein